MSRIAFLACVAAMFAVVAPAIASADSLTVTPCNSGCTPDNASFAAGSNSSFALNASLTGSGAVSDVAVYLTPGLLTNLTANASCLGNAPVTIGLNTAHSANCLAGTGVITTNVPTTIDVDLYQTAATSSLTDVAGIDVVDHSTGVTIAHAELSLYEVPPPATGEGQVLGVLNLPIPAALQSLLSSSGSLVFNFNGTMNSSAATRMPTNCSPPIKSTMLAYYAGVPTATAASTDVANDSGFQTTCAALSFAPSLSVAAQKDAGDNGVDLQTTISQTATQAAALHATLTAPAGTLTANSAALANECTSPNSTFSNCTPVGTTYTTSPLLPGSLAFIASSGNVYLVGSGSSLDLVMKFPAPFNLVLAGAINPGTNTLTFATASGGLDLPDIPLTQFTTILNGGPRALFNVNCSRPTGTFASSYTAQNTKPATSNSSLTVTLCGPNAVTPNLGSAKIGNKSLSGLSKGKPHLKFTVKRGTLTTGLISVRITLPNGLKFPKKLPKKLKGVKVSGAKLASATLFRKQLVLTLASAVNKFTVSLNHQILHESSSLKQKARNRKVGKLTVTLGVTDEINYFQQLKMKFKNPK